MWVAVLILAITWVGWIAFFFTACLLVFEGVTYLVSKAVKRKEVS